MKIARLLLDMARTQLADEKASASERRGRLEGSQDYRFDATSNAYFGRLTCEDGSYRDLD